MKKGKKIFLIIAAAAVVLIVIMLIAQPRSDIWHTQYIWVEDSSGKVQGTITKPRVIRQVIRIIEAPTEEPREDLSEYAPTAQLELITPENGYGPIYYYEEYDICVTAQGEWVTVPRDFYDYLWQSMDAS